MLDKTSFSRNDFFRSKHAAIRTFITIIMGILFVGSTILLLFILFNQNNISPEEAATSKNLLISLIVFELLLFIGYAVWMLFDNRSEITKHVYEVTENLLKESKCAYLVDYKSDTFKEIREIDEATRVHQKDMSFMDEIKSYLENFVYEKDRDFLREELDYNVIIQKLSKKELYTLYYREVEGDKCEWTEMSFSNFSPELFLITISKKSTQILKNKLSELKEDDYFALFVADLDRNEITTLKSSPYYQKSGEPGEVASFVDSMKAFAKVHEGEAKEIFENMSNIDLIKQSLLTENKRLFFYKSSDRVGGSWISITNYVLYRNSDGSPAVISLGFSKLDSYGSDRQELQLQLKDALSMAESVNKAKALFFTNMSFDIRTPMNAVLTYTNLAKNHLDNMEQVENYLNKVQETSSNLSAVINDILDMSKIESGRISMEEKNEDLRDIIRSLNEIVQANIQQKQIKFETNVDIINKNIICDKFRLKQALLNILSNAAKFTPNEGTITFTVKQLSEVAKTTGKYEFKIKDTGVGMSKELLETIYDPFTRKKAFVKAGYTGSGLGMVITKNIIDMMRGEIKIDSIPNKGTEVTITLPLHYSDENVIIAPNREYTKEEFVGTKVLVVEDNPISREILMNILTENGFIVKNAEDGQIALEILKKSKPGDFDFVLMDIIMPNLNGYEATKQIRLLGKPISNIPIIGLTGSAFKEDRLSMVESGMNYHLPKPIQIDHLLEILSKLIHK